MDLSAAAIDSSCAQLGCDDSMLVQRQQPVVEAQPMVHLGNIASGDTVMKSGLDRDRIALQEGVLGFEMEGAGV